MSYRTIIMLILNNFDIFDTIPIFEIMSLSNTIIIVHLNLLWYLYPFNEESRVRGLDLS